MPIIPLYGHSAIRDRLSSAAASGTLPASLLLHGPAGIGKQRLALWLAQRLVCERDPAPCGECRQCGYALELVHPDIHWFFPRERLKDGDATPDDWREYVAESAQERARAGGLYPRPGGMEGLFIGMVRLLVAAASMTPAVAARKVFVIGEADRMSPQEGSEFAANAFLKLLEEPPADTFIVLTSSEPGALLPTIRSRVVSIRVAPLPESDVKAFLADERVAEALGGSRSGSATTERIALAAGAPGRLIGAATENEAIERARRVLEASRSRKRTVRYETSLSQGLAGARGGFTDMLESLTVLLHDEMETAVSRGDERAAVRAARSVDAVEEARSAAQRNVSPQLLATRLIAELAGETT